MIAPLLSGEKFYATGATPALKRIQTCRDIDNEFAAREVETSFQSIMRTDSKLSARPQERAAVCYKMAGE